VTGTSAATVIDLLVVGGGPAGVAAALRAQELGLTTLILEADDLMRRIRDYSKDKLILPGFGGADRMAFPEAGDWIGRLPFEPIDKDDLVAGWKNVCREAGIRSLSGVEMTSLADAPEGLFQVQVYDHRNRREDSFTARHVALAIGRGVPRRFDIPGDTESIPRRLEDPTDYVGAPSCVIGGGTSAAEAVIAISQAKDAAGDPTPVIWSYRGDRLPRVSRVLAESFFEAYAGNGNIRYQPLSEPLMVVTGDDRKPHLAVRVDRRRIPGRPIESMLMEFPTEHCVACVGEDVPETFLASLGIAMSLGGQRGSKRMVVNRLLESRRPRVYLLGDILSQAYLEADDFEADSGTYREVRHRGNIKSALHDGVRVAEAVKQRLDGVADADIVLPEVEVIEPPPRPTSTTPTVAVRPASNELRSQAPPQATPTPTGTRSGKDAWLVQLMPGGIDGDEFPLHKGKVVSLGRGGCDLSFPEDPLLGERHATITFDGESAVLQDGGSENGLFLYVPSRRKLELRPGDLLRAGRQFLLIDNDDQGFVIIHYRADGSMAGRHRLDRGTLVLGRRADVTLDPDDGALSRRHLALKVDGERLLVKDLLSANGTFLRIVGERRLKHGDRFLAGHQLFAFSTLRDAVFDRGPAPHTTSRSVDISLPATAGSASPGVAGGPSITFQPSGKVCPVAAGQTILEVAEAHGVALAAECRAGICGSDPVRIVSGHEHLDAAPRDGEIETLEDLCGLKAGPCRLACMARVKGPVVVEILR
jgi:thioredoxin reductase/pSer/pThr/pTyr-binding forkhead associated (FHA) protein